VTIGFNILVSEGGSTLAVEPDSALQWQSPSSIGVPPARVFYVAPRSVPLKVPKRSGGVWVPPRPSGVTP
jgi:hypothetical protein